MTVKVYTLALTVALTYDHPLRKVFPVIDELPDADAIARLLWAYTRGDYDLVMAA